MKKLFVLAALSLFSLSVLAEVYPYERVCMGITEDLSTSQVVSWRSPDNLPVGKAQIAPVTPFTLFDDLISDVPVITAYCDEDGAGKYYHKAYFNGLEPSTSYLYRVGDDQGNWSEWFEFCTAGKAGQPFSFIYFGDVQKGYMEQAARLVRKAYKNVPDARFAMYVGDLTGSSIEDYDLFFQMQGNLTAQTPFAPVPDNHDYLAVEGAKYKKLPDLWRYTYTYPGSLDDDDVIAKSGTYCFDCQDCRIIMLNVKELYVNEEYSDRIVGWLEEKLSNNPCSFTVVAHHRPLRHMAYHRKGGSVQYEKRFGLRSIYEKYGVDLVLHGHDHVYSRRTTMKGAKKVTPVYVISNAGNNNYVQSYLTEQDRAGCSIQLYQAITVGPKELEYKSYTADGKLYDAFTIKKQGSVKKFIDRNPGTVEYLMPNKASLKRFKEEELPQLEADRAAYEASR